MFAALTDADLEAWRMTAWCLFGMTTVITPAVFFHHRREQTFKWRHKERTQDLEFQKQVFETPSHPPQLENRDADPST